MRKLLSLTITLIFILPLHGEDPGEVRYRSLGLSLNYDELRLSNEERIVPVYTEVKYYLPSKRIFKPFIKSELGFNYVEEREDGEEIENFFGNGYYGIGAGMNLLGVTMELIFANYNVVYQENIGEISENRILLKVKYRY